MLHLKAHCHSIKSYTLVKVKLIWLHINNVYFACVASRERAPEGRTRDVRASAPHSAFTAEAHYSRVVQAVTGATRGLSSQKTYQ